MLFQGSFCPVDLLGGIVILRNFDFSSVMTAEEEDKFYNDKKLWEAADTNKDGKLSKDEFAAMIHPHQFEHMKHFVLEDAMKQLDTDNDGYVSMDEYIGKEGKKEGIEERKK